ncbi:hypothetical protein KJ903_01960 [Patescibacteria group bacterium]|nr:hypothetical protein [Patescibacteria group bacterium]
MPYYISEPVKKLLNSFFVNQDVSEEEGGEEEGKIHVDHFASRMAHVYESMRNMVDYKEEHLLRRNAIERMLKRRILLDQDQDKIAENLIRELIRARYVPNDILPESKVVDVQKIIDKYLLIIDSQSFTKRRERGKFVEWITGIAACEIEDELVSLKPVEAIVEAMFRILEARLVLKNLRLDEPTKKILLYIAAHRALLKSDLPTIRYYLFKLAYNEWFSGQADDIKSVSHSILSIKEEIEGYLNHPLSLRLRRLMKRYTPLFLVLRDVINDDPEAAQSLLQDPASLQSAIENKCAVKYKEAKLKLRRAAVRSIVYIFITKMVLALLLEIPADMFLVEVIEWMPIVINTLFPPFVMLLVALFIRLPGKKNTDKIIQGLYSIVYEEKQNTVTYSIRSPQKKNLFLNIMFKIFYTISFTISFGLIGLILYYLKFNFVSAIIFFLFLTLVSFFGFRVREGAREYVVPAKKESLLKSLFDLYTLPILRAGRWISQEFAKINVFVFIFDFIIEAPFKILVELLEQWFSFVREKKEEII